MNYSSHFTEQHDPNGKNGHAKPARFRLEPLDEIAVTKGPEAVIEDIIFQQTLAVVYGESGCGKSFFVSHMAMHAAAGWQWAGKSTVRGAVVYICAEGVRGFRKRLVAFREQLKPGAVPFYLIAEAPDLGHLDGDAAEIIARIREQSKEPITLIVLDTLARVMQGADESSSVDMGVLVENCARLTAAFGCSVIVIHHAGKDASRGARGSSVLRAAADTEVYVEKSGLGHTATVTKQKDGESELSLRFSLEPVTIDDSEGQTSCVVTVENWQADTGRTKAKVSGPTLVALRALEEAMSDHGEMPPASTLIGRTKRAVRMAVWRDYCGRVQITDVDTPDAKRKAFKRAAEKLQASQMIGVFEEWVWLN